MTKTEQYSIASLVTTVLIFLYLTMRLTEDWRFVEATPGFLLTTYVICIVLVIIAESIWSGVIFSGGSAKTDKDERDLAIEARAEASAGIFLAVVINVIIVNTLLRRLYQSDYPVLNEFLELGSPTEIFYVLFSLLLAGHAVKLVSTLIMYRK
ncbi:MAG: hypothetical protein EVA70_02320 [Parvularculaceae bacterium]|nr:MAG: hypothetical protein EVA70_02320 [Parvularculaceae bacterium]